MRALGISMSPVPPQLAALLNGASHEKAGGISADVERRVKKRKRRRLFLAIRGEMGLSVLMAKAAFSKP
jgi:hypothetical protein